MIGGIGVERRDRGTDLNPETPRAEMPSAVPCAMSFACIGYTTPNSAISNHLCLCDFGIGVKITSEPPAVPTARELRSVWEARRKKRV